MSKEIWLILACLGCSGPAFEMGDLQNDAGKGSPIAGEGNSAGSSQATTGGIGGSATQGGSTAEAGDSSGGVAAMAGGPAMVSGGAGEGGEGGSAYGPSDCLAGYQSLECARVCTNSASDCQAVLNCFIENNSNSLDNCQAFTNIGISLAQSAERTCCND